MSAATLVLAALGCGLGAMARFALGTLRREHHLPWPTLLANVLGTVLLGATAALVDADRVSGAAAIVVGGGVAGGLTTFSTLAVDAVVLWKRSPKLALGYLVTTGALGVIAGWIGWGLATLAM